MSYSRIPVRYAKALFSLAKEKNLLDVFKKDMEIVSSSCSVAQFKSFLQSPVIMTSKKEAVINDIFKPLVNGKTLDFLLLIVKNKREVFLPDVSRNFIDMYRNHKGIKSVTFTSAYEIDCVLKNHIVDTVKKYYPAEIELHQIVEKDIIGGFVLKIDDLQYDASISTKLKKMKRTLTEGASDKK
ncbi:MAG: ATP synthase F1 subunit delta [Bacteroidia bacterium]|nr:ATP synthase F1 subunit delta [Bacteroidia bacterium]